jgi:hypothetical protein
MSGGGHIFARACRRVAGAEERGRAGEDEKTEKNHDQALIHVKLLRSAVGGKNQGGAPTPTEAWDASRLRFRATKNFDVRLISATITRSRPAAIESETTQSDREA